MEELDFSYSVDGMQNGIATLENTLADSYKPEHTPFGSAIPPFVIYPREIKNYINNKNTRT